VAEARAVSLFGGGMQSSLSAPRGREELDRITLFVGALWLICIVGIGLLLKVG